MRVGHNHPQGHHAGGLIHGHIGELQRALFAVSGAIFQLEGHLGPFLLVLGQLALGDQSLQAQQISGGLTHIHIHGIELLDGGQAVSLLGGHQRPLGHRGFTDAATNGGCDAGVTEIDLGSAQGRLARHDLRLGLLPAGVGVVIVLTADGFDLEQLLIALSLEAGTLLVGLGLGQIGFGAGNRRLIDSRVDLIEQIARLHIAPLGKEALEDDAAHLRTHFGHPQRGTATGQLGGQHQRTALQGHHVDRRGGHAALSLGCAPLVTTTCQQACSQQGKTN